MSEKHPRISSSATEMYDGIVSRKFFLLIILFLGVILSFIVDVVTGPAWLSLSEVAAALLFGENSTNRMIIWVIRLPMACMAIFVGAALGLAGAQMQTILDNPLASPYTLGISAAAGFGAALAIVLGVGVLPGGNEFLVPLNAFLFSMLCCISIYLIAWRKRGTTETLVLAGIALLFLFNALTTFLEYISTQEDLQAVVFWLFGSLSKSTWPKVAFVGAVLVIVIPFFLMDAWKLTAMRLGDSKAQSLGVNVPRLRIKSLLLISVLTATAVCFVGIIGFVGLVSPHIARMMVGEDHRYYLPASLLGGALLLSVSSIASKLVIPGSVFPIGIATSCIGVPFFLYLILRRRSEFW
ncbi:MAG TPA: iron ABC transporter permease [Methanospirillum sp.]|nr:iron ABC transporter permease [Methanospirillum sp.]